MAQYQGLIQEEEKSFPLFWKEWHMCEGGEESLVAIFKDNSPHQETEHVTKTKTKQNNLETRNRPTGDPDAGDFRKKLEYLRLAIMELSVSKGR